MQGYSVYLPHPSLECTEQLTDAKDNVQYTHLTNEIAVSFHRDLGYQEVGRGMLQTVASIQKIKYWSYISRGRLSEVWLNGGGGEWMINEYRT